MTIFAVKNIFEKLVILKEPISNNDILSYDKNVGAFINVSADKVFNIPITSFIQINSTSANNYFSIVEKISGNSIDFKSLVGLNGIKITDTNGTLVFESTNTFQGAISENSYSIVIDYDDDNSNARFSVRKVNSVSSFSTVVSSLPELLFLSYEIVFSSGTSFLVSNVDVSAFGFENEMLILLSGTPSGIYDGIYQINEIDSSASTYRIDLGTVLVSSSYINVPLSGLKIKQIGIYASVSGIFSHNYSQSSNPFFLNIWKNSPSNFPSGTFISLSNTKDGKFDKNYIIASAQSGSTLGNKWTTLLLDVQTPLIGVSSDTAIESENSNYNISILGNVQETGFSVDKNGYVYGNRFFTSALPTVSYELVNKSYVDSEISNLLSTAVSSISANISGLESRINKIEKNNKKTLRLFLQYARF